MSTIENHLKGITTENLLEYRKDSFSMYARARGVELGFNGLLDFIVRHDGLDEKYANPHVAVERYKELLRERYDQ